MGALRQCLSTLFGLWRTCCEIWFAPKMNVIGRTNCLLCMCEVLFWSGQAKQVCLSENSLTGYLDTKAKSFAAAVRRGGSDMTVKSVLRSVGAVTSQRVSGYGIWGLGLVTFPCPAIRGEMNESKGLVQRERWGTPNICTILQLPANETVQCNWDKHILNKRKFLLPKTRLDIQAHILFHTRRWHFWALTPSLWAFRQ